MKSGYDHFYGFRGGAVDYYRHAGNQDDFWDDDVPLHQIGYLTDLLGTRAVDVVNAYAKSATPFLLSLHFNAPHWPWEAPGDEAESERLRGKPIAHYDRLVAEWLEWNGTMLPEVDESSTSNFTGDQFADHIGTPRTSGTADNPPPKTTP